MTSTSTTNLSSPRREIRTKSKQVLIESIRKAKAERAKAKGLADQSEAPKKKARALKARKVSKKDEAKRSGASEVTIFYRDESSCVRPNSVETQRSPNCGEVRLCWKYICPKAVKEQMMIWLDEIGENHENLKAKVVPYTTNKTEQTRGEQKKMHVPMEMDHVGGSEPEDEDGEDVKQVRRGSMCHNCGMMGHFAKDCRMKGKGEGKGGDGKNGYAKSRGKTMKGTGKKGTGKFRGSKGGLSGDQKSWRMLRTVLDMRKGRSQVVRKVGGESPASMKKMQTAEKAEDHLEECG